VIKYGETIGLATSDISPGEHVHVHNVEGQRGRGDRR
jgi:altronate dehydratase small subunit